VKVVVTILQCRRAVLPHVFIRYVLPRMRALFPGSVECVLVQHRADAASGETALESLRHGRDKLELVARWTAEGRYDGADIIGHDILHAAYPSIPSLHLGVKEALARHADFHLWLEDDALVFDRDCAHWDALLGGREVGVYRPFHHLNSAYLLTRPSFDRRVLGPLSDHASFTWRGRRIEPFLRQHMRTRRAYLEPRYAVRYHHRYYPYTGLRYVVDALRELAPEALPLLDLDFGPGCASLPPITPAELRAHAAGEGARLSDRLWRLRQRLVERYLLSDALPESR
jgi:hypothetical protein